MCQGLPTDAHLIRPIGHIETDFPQKFGIPRQSGLVDALLGRIVLAPEYRREEALRRIEDFSHLWIIWQFSKALTDAFHPTVRPPRLGGNTRVGVFASRAPFRPNGLGLSSVKLIRVDYACEDAPALIVSGVDMLSGTPVYDIKPYIPMTDCHPDAAQGYTARTRMHALRVDFAEPLLQLIPTDKREALLGVLACDPRPGYEDAPDACYGVRFDAFDIGFVVANGVLTVKRVTRVSD